MKFPESVLKYFFLICLSGFLFFGNCSSSQEKEAGGAEADNTKKSDPAKKTRSMEDSGDDKSLSGANPGADSAAKTESCLEGNCTNGYGVFLYSTGEKYSGNFKDNMREGQGKIVYPDGESYSGDFTKDKKDGYGEYKFKNGDNYIGAFKEGIISGKGVYKFVDGKIFEGDFLNNGNDGSGTLKAGEIIQKCQIKSRDVFCE
ncbi:MAG: hypothetical protein K8R21_11680 [Leptospira sp.]|nr:hypothetical protein [Leptospira sp.]